MAVDLTGGLRPEQDYCFGAKPDDPEMRQSANLWISVDGDVDFGFPRCAAEAVGSEWDSPQYSFQAAWADGRVLIASGKGPQRRPEGPAGLSAVFGAGPFEMRCVEPFRRWTAHYEGSAIDTSLEDQIHRRVDRTRIVDVALHVEAEMAVPPWIQGTLSADAERLLAGDTVEAAFMGGFRFEQLFRGSGSFRVDGSPERTFTCTGLRIFRQGVRNISGFWGHCWQSALFPSGRAFGYIAYPQREGEPRTYAEGYVFEGDGPLIPATLVEAPWMTGFLPQGSVPCVLQTGSGTSKIAGSAFVSVFHRFEGGFPPLHQGGARYTWDGEETRGMIERSYPADLMSW